MEDCVLALGFFDGVHLGHGGLLRRTRMLADQLGLPAVALTMDNHPDMLVRGVSVPLINTAEERAWLMKTFYGIDQVRTLHFDSVTMEQPWQEFVSQTIYNTHRAVHVVCGHDYRFGAKGEGTPEKLAAACQKLGVGCDCIPEIRLEGQTISSTLIRSLLEAGEMARAVRFLGHPHIISGRVISGQRLGRTLGIPTANLSLSPDVLLPRHGVYGAKAYFDGMERLTVVNIGVRPTVNGKNVTIEPWILDYDGDLYDHALRLELREFLRPERKFDSLAAMRDEILHNAAQVRALFGAR